MNHFLKTSLVSLLASTLAASLHAQGSATPAAPAPVALVKPGLWEITVTSEAPGSDRSRSNVFRQCYSAAAATDIRQLLPPQHELGMQCQNHDPKMSGLEASWQITCTGKSGSLGGTATLTFVGGGYQGRAKLDHTAPGSKPSKVVQIMSGKLLGNCP